MGIHPAADERVVADAREKIDPGQRIENGLARPGRQAGIARGGREVDFISRGQRLQ